MAQYLVAFSVRRIFILFYFYLPDVTRFKELIDQVKLKMIKVIMFE